MLTHETVCSLLLAWSARYGSGVHVGLDIVDEKDEIIRRESAAKTVDNTDYEKKNTLTEEYDHGNLPDQW